MGTVAKALSLLGFFTRDRAEIGLTEMTRLAGMNKATVFRLLGELQSHGFVEQSGAERSYRLGPAFPRLASLREANVPMREVGRKVLTMLSEATGETAHMSTLQGQQLNVIAYVYSTQHGTRVTMEDAEQIHLHATSSGMAVLAFSEPAFVDQVLRQPLAKLTSQTVTDPDQLRDRFDEVRRTGIADSVSGFELDVHSHAAPIFDAAQACIGAIAVATPTTRMNEELRMKIRQELGARAIEVTRLLGGFAPSGFKERVAPTHPEKA